MFRLERLPGASGIISLTDFRHAFLAARDFSGKRIRPTIATPPSLKRFFVSNKSIRAVLVLHKSAGWSRAAIDRRTRLSYDPKVDESAVRVRVYFSRERKSVSRVALKSGFGKRRLSFVISSVHFVSRELTSGVDKTGA